MATSTLVCAQAPPTARTHTRAILAVALTMRVFAAVLLTMTHAPIVQVRSHTELFAIAISLVQGHGFSSPFFAPSGPSAFLSPGYPLFLALIFRIFGVGSAAFLVIVAIQILFSLITVWLVMVVAREHFSARVADIAGCICAASLPLAIAPFIVWETCLSSLLLLAFFATIPRVRTRGQWAAAGGAASVTALINPSLVPAIFLLGAWRAWRRRTIPWAALLVFVLLYAAWPVRNAVVMHAWIPLRSNFGYELWMGNHPGGNGNFQQALNPEANGEERARFVSLGELGFMRWKTAASVDYIRTHPGIFLATTVRRVGRFWTASTQGLILTGTLFSGLALAGLVVLWRRRPDLRFYAIPLLIYPLPYYITHPDARFRYVLDPLLAILIAYVVNAALPALTTVAGPKEKPGDNAPGSLL